MLVLGVEILYEMKTNLMGNISSVFAVVAGHTTIPEVLNQYNFYSIDTGACFEIDGYGNLTVLKLSTMEVV